MAKLAAGIDIDNATTEVALAETGDVDGQVDFLSSAIVPTTGIKGTSASIHGLLRSLTEALNKAGRRIEDFDSIRINEAVPVIDDVTMGTAAETIIAESTMIGHNPSTPGGLGIRVGITIVLDELSDVSAGQPHIVVAPRAIPYDQVAARLNAVTERLEVIGATLQADDGVLVHNRLVRKTPIVDEARLTEKVPLGTLAATEVVNVGCIVETLSNPFGIATLFGLEADVTRSVVSLARFLVGNHSAVVTKTSEGDMQERRIPAGHLIFHGTNTLDVDVDLGAAKIMDVAFRIRDLSDITGEADTDVGGMMEKVWVTMAQPTNQRTRDIRITDLPAVSTRAPQQAAGGIANELSMEAIAGIAVMVRTDRLQMEWIASEPTAETGVPVEVGGVEADMAIRGVLITPGTVAPIAILDMGASSTDASVTCPDGTGISIHLAGAGNTMTLTIQSELGLDSFNLAGDIKRHPLAEVESVFNVRHEDGTVQFFEDPFPGYVYARIVVLKPDGMVPLDVNFSVETIRQVRIRTKEQVFVTSAIRVLQRVSPTSEVHGINFVMLVGGSAPDFKIPQLVTRVLADYRVVAGRANIRGAEGPRNIVATGLVLGGMS